MTLLRYINEKWAQNTLSILAKNKTPNTILIESYYTYIFIRVSAGFNNI